MEINLQIWDLIPYLKENNTEHPNTNVIPIKEIFENNCSLKFVLF